MSESPVSCVLEFRVSACTKCDRLHDGLLLSRHLQSCVPPTHTCPSVPACFSRIMWCNWWTSGVMKRTYYSLKINKNGLCTTERHQSGKHFKPYSSSSVQHCLPSSPPQLAPQFGQTQDHVPVAIIQTLVKTVILQCCHSVWKYTYLTIMDKHLCAESIEEFQKYTILDRISACNKK